MNINEIIGRALLDLPDRYVDERGPDMLCIDGEWKYETIGAAVVKALGEAGYAILPVQKAGGPCSVCGQPAGIACLRDDCGSKLVR